MLPILGSKVILSIGCHGNINAILSRDEHKPSRGYEISAQWQQVFMADQRVSRERQSKEPEEV